MLKRFRNMSIGTKLMLTTAALIFLFLSLFTYLVTSFTASIIEKNALSQLKNQAELVKTAIEVFSNNINQNTAELSRVFISYFPDRFALESSRQVDIGGRNTPVLRNGAVMLNLNNDMIDKFTQMTGAVATIFARQGDDFVRISTSLKKSDGSRAVGTLLGREHPGYKSLMNGEEYSGRANLFGKTYSTRYVPVRDAGGDTIGILFVGQDISGSLDFVKKKIKSIKIGETGYIYALDGEQGAGYGTLAIHPLSEGKKISEIKDAGSDDFYQEILNNKNGSLSYMWLNRERGETTAREKIAAYTFFDDWQWEIVAAAYLEELIRDTVTLKRTLYAATLVVIACLLAALYFASRRMVTLPLRKGVDFARTVAAGDLTRSLEVKSRDEAGALAEALNGMAEGLRSMVEKIKHSSGQVASTADEISANSAQLTRAAHSQATAAEETSSTMVQMATSIQTVAENADSLAGNAEEVSSSIQQLGASSEQVAKSAETMASSVSETSATIEQMTVSIEKVAQNSEELAASVAETSSTIEQMTVSIDQVASHAGELGKTVTDSASAIEQLTVSINLVAKNAEEADIVAKSAAGEGAAGQQAVREALEAMKRVAEISEKSAASINNLGKRSEEIGNIVKVINAIADQTNLLALNAAIEAARAGDAGRGFAVVADEVRKLAERSVSATSEIETVIREVQSDTLESVKFGELASREAQSSMELSGIAGNALQNIVKNIEQTSTLMSEIARMTEEQALAASRVNESVGKMRGATEVVTGAAREQALGGKQIRMAVERMNNNTREVTGATREQAQGSRQIRMAVENMNVVTCQVNTATREQSLSARQIMEAVGAMNAMTRSVANATQEQKKGGEMIVSAAENISDLSRENLAAMEELSRAARSLSQQAADLAGLVTQFKIT